MLALTLFAAPALLVPPSVQLGDRTVNGENSIAIVWQTEDREGEDALRFSQGGRARMARVTHRTVRVEGTPSHRVHTAVLDRLTLGTSIAYRVLDGETSLYRGEMTAPKSAGQPYTFAVFGDGGTGTDGQAEIAYRTHLAKPDLLLLTGDLVYDRGRIAEYRENFYPRYTAPAPSMKAGAAILPSILTAAAPGNHDILTRDLDKYPDGLAYFYYWSQPLNGPGAIGAPNTPVLSGVDARKAAFLAGAGSNYPRMANFSFDYGNAHITSLDMNPYMDWSEPSIRRWLAADLAKGAGKTWRFVMLHQPGFHSSNSHQGEKQMRAVADLFEDAKVDLVFAGHVHNYQRSHPIQVGAKRGAAKEELAKDDWAVDTSFDGTSNTKPKGVLYIVDGAGGRGLYNPELQGKPELWKPFQAKYIAALSFSTVRVEGKRLTLTQIDAQGNEVDRFTVTK